MCAYPLKSFLLWCIENSLKISAFTWIVSPWNGFCHYHPTKIKVYGMCECENEGITGFKFENIKLVFQTILIDLLCCSSNSGSNKCVTFIFNNTVTLKLIDLKLWKYFHVGSLNKREWVHENSVCHSENKLEELFHIRLITRKHKKDILRVLYSNPENVVRIYEHWQVYFVIIKLVLIKIQTLKILWKKWTSIRSS